MDFFIVKEKKNERMPEKNIKLRKEIERIVKKFATRHNL